MVKVHMVSENIAINKVSVTECARAHTHIEKKCYICRIRTLKCLFNEWLCCAQHNHSQTKRACFVVAGIFGFIFISWSVVYINRSTHWIHTIACTLHMWSQLFIDVVRCAHLHNRHNSCTNSNQIYAPDWSHHFPLCLISALNSLFMWHIKPFSVTHRRQIGAFHFSFKSITTKFKRY